MEHSALLLAGSLITPALLKVDLNSRNRNPWDIYHRVFALEVCNGGVTRKAWHLEFPNVSLPLFKYMGY